MSHLQKFPNEISNKKFDSAHFLTCNLEGLKIKMPKTLTLAKGMLNENGVLKSTSTPTKGMFNQNGVLKSTRKLNGDQVMHLWGCIEKPMAWSW